MPDVAISSACFAPLVEAVGGNQQLGLQVIDGTNMPEPYRALLVNHGDMTTTLERFHGCRLHIAVLGRVQDGDIYSRQVILLDEHENAVEYGAIRIHLAALPLLARQEVLAGQRPLGGVLVNHGVPHTSHPSAFFALMPNAAILAALHLQQPL
ncbi:MAG: hypothetical protein AAB263_06505, partial [Planctomycetota bacterium]